MKRLWLLGALVVALAQPRALELAGGTVTYTASQPGEVWQGRAPIARLEGTLDPENVRATRVRVVLEPARFNSGNILRDTNARRTVFNVREYPEITFELRHASTEGNRLPDGASQAVAVRGELTMHGVTRPLETILTVSRSGASVRVQGGFSVLLSDFNMRRPTFFTRVVDDAVTIALELEMQLGD